MAKSLQEYVEWLGGRDDLIWPQPPKPEPAKAKAFIKPLRDIRAVVWNVYGTLLHLSDGQLRQQPEKKLFMQVALEKTIKEFNMWHSMSRKPGAPWEYLYRQYMTLIDDAELEGTERKGDKPHVSSVAIWKKLIGRLQKNKYEYDEDFYGDADELSEKVAYFFHINLQGVDAMPNALRALISVAKAGLTQGLLADAQSFTLVQLLRVLKGQGKLPPLGQLFRADCLTLSFQVGTRKPSKTLYETCVDNLRQSSISPPETLYIASRVSDDLAIAKQVGMRTALYAGEKASLKASSADMTEPQRKPDRLITDLGQIKDLLEIG